MNAQVPGISLVRVVDIKISEPERLLLLQVEAASGQTFWLTLPTGEAPLLARAAGLGLGFDRDEQLRNHALKALNASWVEFLAIPEEPEALAMSVTFGSGATLTFRLPKPMPQTILETLQVALMKEAPQAPPSNPPPHPGNTAPREDEIIHHYKQ
ncbi:hypothetical protein ACELLULO517_16100 [Acidisoma cellulosilytica]|uniref:Uncharacterized protein n=1 Tax=Acidisoma cellulosilyticum TaxID=2802395 RepID=A0A963Z4I3_9PROT|nr:hypothetical protein [Acidisoma cellulosilyticum]MCB8881772.1 hypothetical protein [Acidisoma cellulosilyticum]